MNCREFTEFLHEYLFGTLPAAERAEFEKQASSAPEPYRSLASMIAAQLREPVDAQVTALAASAQNAHGSSILASNNSRYSAIPAR